jgi:hypothetical protein
MAKETKPSERIARIESALLFIGAWMDATENLPIEIKSRPYFNSRLQTINDLPLTARAACPNCLQ